MTRLIPHNQPWIDSADIRSVQQVLNSRWLAEGKFARRLETALGSYLNRPFAKVTSSGTAALHLALLALGIGRGDEVILSTYVCTALLNAVHYVGARPVPVDILEDNLGPSPEAIRKKISKKTKAIMVNHAFGLPSSLFRIRSLGIPIIEDCAQALGSEMAGKKAGSFGDLTVLSFYATKMMTAGYGGMVLTPHKPLFDRILDLTHFDQRKDYKIRFNYYLSDILCALGLSQFKKLDRFIQQRRSAASRYIQSLRKTELYFWQGESDEKPNFYRFVIGGLKPARHLIQKLKKQGIQAISPLEPYQLLHRYLGLQQKEFPVAEAMARHLVSIPIHPSLTPAEITRVGRALERAGN